MTVALLLNLVDLFMTNPVAKNITLATEMKYLATQMMDGLSTYGIIDHPIYGQMFGYEVDGFGNSYAMDDANIPSLLSLPYLGVISTDSSLYQNTRKFILSPNNPYYFSGSVASGIGGPHVGIGYIWPMAIIMQAQTSEDDSEIQQCLEWLKASSAGTGFMHESFNRNNASDYTRSWFAWANSQFGNLILTLAESRPYLIFNDTDTSQFTNNQKRELPKKTTPFSIFDTEEKFTK